MSERIRFCDLSDEDRALVEKRWGIGRHSVALDGDAVDIRMRISPTATGTREFIERLRREAAT